MDKSSSFFHLVRKFIVHTPYRKEITFAIAFKLGALLLLSALFLSFPIDKQLEKPQVIKHYLLAD